LLVYNKSLVVENLFAIDVIESAAQLYLPFFGLDLIFCRNRDCSENGKGAE